jgi:hypothetical protein
MNERFQLKGWWKIPGRPNGITGTLTFDSDKGGKLDLIGSFKDVTRINDIDTFDIIQGISTDGKLLTLYNCIETNTSFSTPVPNMLVSTFYVQTIITGINFSNTNEMKFKSISVSFTNLDFWIEQTGFTRPQRQNNELNVTYVNIDPIKVKVENDLYISLVTNLRSQQSQLNQFNLPRELKMSQKYYFKLESEEQKTLDEYLDLVQKLGNFLSLLLSSPVLLAEVNLAVDLKTIKRLPETYYHQDDIKAFFSLAIKPKSHLRYYDVLLPYSIISHWYPQLLRIWYEDSENLKTIHDLYFGYVYNTKMYLYQGFLSLVHCLEAFHRHNFPDHTEMAQNDHDKLISEILSSVNQDHKDWLSKQLDHSNEVILRSRINKLISEYPLLKKFFSSNTKMDSFVNKVVITRNYLTHYDEENKKNAAEGEELGEITDKIKLFLDVLFLSRLGFDQIDLEIMFSQVEPYQKEVKR